MLIRQKPVHVKGWLYVKFNIDQTRTSKMWDGITADAGVGRRRGKVESQKISYTF